MKTVWTKKRKTMLRGRVVREKEEFSKMKKEISASLILP